MAFMELSLIVIFLIILAVLVIGAFFWWGLKHAILLAVNSVIGFFALYAVQAWMIESLVINVWSVLFVAIFGIIGLFLVLLLHWVGIWF